MPQITLHSKYRQTLRDVARDMKRIEEVLNRLDTLTDVPSAASDPGKKGQFKGDSSYIYYCVADNEWERVAIATW